MKRTTRLALCLTAALWPWRDLAAGEWKPLIEAKRYQDAKALCGSWTAAEKDVAEQAEGHKCLAAIELAAGPAGAIAALKHLDRAVLLLPADISTHQDRLRLAMDAGRFGELTGYLEHSLKSYPGKDGLEYWLTYCSDLEEQGQYDTGLKFTRLLEKSYPKDHRVMANLGAFLALLKREKEALVYAKKAVALEPLDPINLWNLGRLYDRTEQLALADRSYRKAIALEKDRETLTEHRCAYAHFLAEKRDDKAGACRLEKTSCDEEDRAACEAPQ